MFPRRKILFLTLALAGFGLTLACAGETVPLKKNDRIVFLGDSITQGGVGPQGYVTLIKKALLEKHPDLNLQIIGAGISGNKVPDLQRRLDRDVLARQPTIVFIYIGINDVWHGERNPANGTTPKKFVAGLKEIIGKIQEKGARVILCTPSVIGEKRAGSNPLDAKLDEYAGLSRQVAQDMKVQLCDLRKAFVDHLKNHNPKNQQAGILTGDRVHLNAAGNRFVADVMLKALGE